ncbi:MAG: hypothetical protein ACM3JB_01275 [Acidobacteriaceae bacterium]
MKKATLLLSAALLCSPALFAQESSSTPAQSTTTQSTTQTTTTKTTKSKLTAEQKTELKDLRAKVKTECKADKTSDACKQAKADLKAKRQEYGMTGTHHMKHNKGAAASTANPS